MNFRKILSLVLVLNLLFLTACRKEPSESTVPPVTTVAVETTIPETTVPETTAPPVTEPAFPLHSGIREDGSFDEGTLFIGDSLTNGLLYIHMRQNKLIGNSKYMAIVGAPPQDFFYGPKLCDEISCIQSWEFTNKTMSQGVAAVGKKITAVYFMMGTNYSSHTNTDTYIKITDYLLKHCPNATIYLQTVPYSTSPNVAYEAMNRYIREAQQHYVDEGITRVLLINTMEAIGEHLNADGVHLNPQGYACWYQAILDFAAENSIPQ